MRTILVIYLFLIAFTSFGQIKECGIEKLNFKVNPYPRIDTIGDLILTSNAYHFTKSHRNIIFLNKSISSVNYSIETADACFYKNDTILIITPTSYKWNFTYENEGKSISKEFKANLRPMMHLLIQFDNRIQNQNLTNFKFIDSLSFDLDLADFEKWYPNEDFTFTIKEIAITLVRNKRIVKEKKIELNTKFYIGDLLKRGKQDDRLIISYYPQWVNLNGELSYLSSGQLSIYSLGRKK